MERKHTTSNSHIMSLGKKRGIGELRDRQWYYTEQELAELKAELNTSRVNRSEAQKEARRASFEAYKKREQESARVAEAKLIERMNRQRIAKREQDEQNEQAHRSGLARMYDHDFIDDKDVFAAVSFARKMIRTGTTPGLANYKAARYYNVDVSTVARYVGQVASKKRHKAAP